MRRYLGIGLAVVLVPTVALAATFSKQFTITGTAPPVVATVTDVTTTGLTFQAGVGSKNKPIGTFNVVMNPVGAPFVGTIALNECTTVAPVVCTPTTKFVLSSTTSFPTNVSVGATDLPAPVAPATTVSYSVQVVTNTP